MCAVRSVFRKVAGRLAAARAQSEFNCGDCERWERCGRAPTGVCIVREAQLENRDRRVPRRYLRVPVLEFPRW